MRCLMIHVYCMHSWTLIDKLAKVCLKKKKRKKKSTKVSIAEEAP